MYNHCVAVVYKAPVSGLCLLAAQSNPVNEAPSAAQFRLRHLSRAAAASQMKICETTGNTHSNHFKLCCFRTLQNLPLLLQQQTLLPKSCCSGLQLIAAGGRRLHVMGFYKPQNTTTGSIYVLEYLVRRLTLVPGLNGVAGQAERGRGGCCQEM